MFANDSKNTIRVILRSKATRFMLAALLLAILFNLYYFFSSASFMTKDVDYYHSQCYYKYIYNVVSALVNTFLPPFIILICCYTVQYDKKNYFRDVQISTQLKRRTYYLSHLTAYFTFFFLIALLSIFLSVFATLLSPQLKMHVETADILRRVARNVLLIGVPSIITYISVSVGFTLMTNKTAVGILLSVLYLIFPQFLYLTDIENLFWVPHKIEYYFYYFNSPFMSDFINDSHFKTSLKEASLCYLLILCIDLLLLMAGYFSLLKREGKS